MRLELASLEATSEVGHLIGRHLKRGCVLLLCGNLGSGKTTLTKSICAALSVPPDGVISPTYTIVNVYQGRWLIHHVDLYRLTAPEDLDNFDWEDLICEDGVTLVEWPELLVPLLDDEPRLEITLQPLSETARLMEMEAQHARFDDLFQALKGYEYSGN